MRLNSLLVAFLTTLLLGMSLTSTAQAHDRSHRHEGHHPSFRGSVRHHTHYHHRHYNHYRHDHRHRHYHGCRHASHYPHRHYRPYYHPHFNSNFHYHGHGHSGVSVRLHF